MTDPLIGTLSRLADPDPAADVTPDPAALATGALRRARRRTRTRRVAVATAVPFAAAAAVLAVSVLPGGLVGALRGDDGPAASPTRSADDPWGAAPRVGVLLLGTDAVPGRTGYETDSVVLASIDTRTGETLLVGVPRNRLGGRDAAGRWRISPDPRTAPVEPQVEALTGQHVDATIRVDMAGFEQLVDILGGVEVTVRDRLPMGGKRTESGGVLEQPTAYLMPGTQRLDGRGALWFARSRFASDDYDRMRRQRCLIGAVVRQVDAPRLLTRLPGILDALRGHVVTTIALGDLPAWVDLAAKARTARVRSVVLTVPVLPDGSPDVEGSAAAVTAALEGTTASGAPTNRDGSVGTGAAPAPWAPVDVSAAC